MDVKINILTYCTYRESGGNDYHLSHCIPSWIKC